jgi:hypothetical protein
VTGAPVFGLAGLGFSVGDPVEVRAFRRWRPGKVTGLGRTRVKVKYSTRKGWRSREGTFGAEDIRRPRSAADPPEDAA